VDIDEDGVYRCAGCGSPLFDSGTKFDSGTGWPSFTEAVGPDAVTFHEDMSRGFMRTEVRCARCESHLGHVYEDGPQEAGGQRWCINSAALNLDRG
jgi:peptide-methionine (R)-S-oxide reductase